MPDRGVSNATSAKPDHLVSEGRAHSDGNGFWLVSLQWAAAAQLMDTLAPADSEVSENLLRRALG